VGWERGAGGERGRDRGRSLARSSVISFMTLLLTVAMIAAPAWAQEEPPAPGPLELFVQFSRSQLAATGFTRHEAEVEGRRMVWWQKGEGPTVVMVHGVASQAGSWFLVAPGMAEDHRVLLVDLPGHGESEPESGPLAMSTVVAGFESWLAEHATGDGTEPATLVGNSMGAWVATLAALHHPERVRRLVLVNGGGLRADTGELDLLPESREEARRLMAALRDPSSPQTPDAVLDDLVRRVPGGEVERMFAEEEDLESHLLDGRLGEVETPVDVLWGESDRYLGRDYPDRLVAELPNARLTLVPRCGHLPQAECPQRFAERLGELLASPPPGDDEVTDGKETGGASGRPR